MGWIKEAVICTAVVSTAVVPFTLLLAVGGVKALARHMFQSNQQENLREELQVAQEAAKQAEAAQEEAEQKASKLKIVNQRLVEHSRGDKEAAEKARTLHEESKAHLRDAEQLAGQQKSAQQRLLAEVQVAKEIAQVAEEAFHVCKAELVTVEQQSKEDQEAHASRLANACVQARAGQEACLQADEEKIKAYNVSMDHMKGEMLNKWRRGEQYHQAEEVASRNSTWLEKDIWLLKEQLVFEKQQKDKAIARCAELERHLAEEREHSALEAENHTVEKQSLEERIDSLEEDLAQALEVKERAVRSSRELRAEVKKLTGSSQPAKWK